MPLRSDIEAMEIPTMLCNIYRIVGRSIADIYPTRGKYAAEVRYRGPPYHTIYVISYGECVTDEPYCMRWPNSFKKMRLYTRRL